MKAVTFNPSNNQFQVVEKEIPKPQPDEVLVKVHACGLNPVDAKIIHWKTSVPHMNHNWTPGLDVAGEIVAKGAKVAYWNVGDKVLYHGNMYAPHGGFAEYSIHKAESLLSHPNTTSSIAASSPCAGWTAWRALFDKLRIQKNHSLLIMGASGGVGSFAIQIAKIAGVQQIIACCSSKNHSYVRTLGATHTIDYQDEHWLQKIAIITNEKGVDRALDGVGRDQDIAISKSLAFEGEMVALVSTLRCESYENIFARSLSFHQLSLGAVHQNTASGLQPFLAAAKNFTMHLEKGTILVPQLHKISIEEVGHALEKMIQRNTTGKIVMTLFDD